jgi:hypothetical protein
MTATKGNVIYLHQRNPQEALERLNRITGLRFSSWPQSLVNVDTATAQSSAVGAVENSAVDSTGTLCEPCERVSG